MLVLGWQRVADCEEVHCAAGITPELTEFSMGEPIYLDFNLTNTGSKSFLLNINSRQWGLTGSYRIQVFDASGIEVSDKREHPFVGSRLAGVTEVKAGNVYVDRLYLPTFIKFNQPGDYTMVVRRSLGFGQMPETHRLMRNGSFHSGDGLNWVDEYVPATPDGNFILGRAGFISTVYTSYVTNSFKVTVLPTDPNRQLKRAQEMLVKLDGIGARDVVAKTNGPRALDRNVDWETVRSAWLVGDDNLSLAWAVRVLSDIGDQQIIPELKRHLNDNSMKVRFACVRVLCALGEQLRPEWIVPIIKSKQWHYENDPEQFASEHGGTNASSILIECLDMSDPSVTNVWNYRLINIIKKKDVAELNFHYNYDGKRTGNSGTPDEIEENAKVLKQLQDWLKTHPVEN